MGQVVGRERELLEMSGFLAAIDEGPALLVLEGEAGIGKTALWEEAVAGARSSSFAVLTARPTEAEAGHAFGALSDLLEPVIDDVMGELPVPQRRAIAIALLREDPGPGRLDRRAVSAATLGVLRLLAGDGRVLLAIDDAQWLDTPSAHVLGYVIRRLAGLPIGVLLSERTGARPDGALMFVGGDLAVEYRRLVRVGPMSVASLHGLLKARLGRSFSRRTVVRLEEMTTGNPFFALEIARGLPGDPIAGNALPIPRSLGELVADRVRSLGETARQSLLAAAAMRSPDADLVVSALDRPAGEVRAGLEEAEAADVIVIDGGSLRFVHPLYAAAVYAAARLGERRAVHRALAAVTDDEEERARHLALGADRADVQLAAVLDAAADRSSQRGAPESAAELIEWALKLTPSGSGRDEQRRMVRAAEYRFHAGDLRSASELLDDVLTRGPTNTVRAQALRLLGEVRYTEAGFPEAKRLLTEALAHARGDARTEGTIALRLALTLRAMDDFEAAETQTRHALDLAERSGDAALLAEALALVARLDFLLGHGLDERRLERALALDDANRPTAMQMRPRKIAGDLFVYAGQLERAVQILDEERARALERGEDSDLPFVLGHLTWAECWRGNLPRATELACESLENAERVGGPSECLALVFASLVAAHAGDVPHARSWGERGLALARSTAWHTGVVWASWALGFLALSVDDPSGTDAVLGPLAATVEAGGLVEPVRAMYLADEIEAVIALGDLDRAGRLSSILEDAGRAVDRAWAIMQAGRCRALLTAAMGDVEGAAKTAAAALAAGAGLELRIELARTLLVAGQIERRRRRKAGARDLLERAKAIFDDAGVVLWSRRADHDLARAAGRSTGAELTASEDRIARLTARGLTNREVAAQVFASTKTVEATLARVYRKLGIKTRAELGALLGRREAHPSK